MEVLCKIKFKGNEEGAGGHVNFLESIKVEFNMASHFVGQSKV